MSANLNLDLSNLQRAVTDACALIDRLRTERNTAQAGWEEVSDRCEVLLDALEEIANHATDGPQDYERMARLLVARARAAIAWTPNDDEDREPPEPDGECFRGGEAAAYEAEQQAWIQRNLK